MKNPYKARVSAREFLNLPGIHDGAYVVAYVEDTSERGLETSEYRDERAYNPHPRFILEIADCNTDINLEFEIHNPLHRKNSFHKIDTLIAALEEFRAGMAAECVEFKRRQRELDALAAEKEAHKNGKLTKQEAHRRIAKSLGVAGRE